MASWILPAFLVAFAGNGSDCQVLHFTADWCQPCQQMAPTVSRLKADGWQIQPVDTTLHRDVASRFRVQNLPTFVIISGGREVDRLVGVASYETLSRRVARAARHSSSGQTGASNAARASIAQTQQFASHQPDVSQPNTLQPPSMIVRGQSDNRPAPVAPASFRSDPGGFHLSPQQAIRRAQAATVRIRVDEPNSTAFGTGTIVHSHGQEALVLTCGHLFRNMTPGSQLTVDLFSASGIQTVPARLVDFKADQETEDIGLISFVLPYEIEPVPIAPKGITLTVGQGAFSFGCDHGDDPTRHDTQIKHVNRYLGPANVEIAGAPAVGRSGGGLFDMHGNLVGVCNAADETDDEGIYAAVGVVYGQLARLGLDQMVSPDSPDLSATTASHQQGPASHEHAVVHAGPPGNAPAVQQVVCIMRDANGVEKVVTIDRPTSELMSAISASSAR